MRVPSGVVDLPLLFVGAGRVLGFKVQGCRAQRFALEFLRLGWMV